MRHLLISLLLVSGSVLTDDLSDANKFLAAQQYDKALPLYTRLANAGNAEAQFRVGEMAWYGDGMRQDLQAAHAWFTKAAAGGGRRCAGSPRGPRATPDAGRGNRLLAQPILGRGPSLRQVRVQATRRACRVDFQCVTRASIEAWQTCHNGFVVNFNASAPLSKRVPADVLDMMTPHEIDRARNHIESVYHTVLVDAQRDVDAVRTAQTAWGTATERFAKEENVHMKRKFGEETRLIVGAQRRGNDYATLNRREPRPVQSSVRATK